ncbi:hypothetical protein AXF42_Ash002312 [Apostasia shenzhenica]|uniref:Cell differentiation protein RCD1 like n=1 Tax=Apostasia shenzhenica TaxID=1088818 RepID=A0A2I0AN63_9ASPA|nr:hypothetical protein AXF42_Ash002312 [Apostasia shenzhenica]
MKSDLDYIFMKLRSMKSRIKAIYPDAFPDASAMKMLDQRPDLERPLPSVSFITSLYLRLRGEAMANLPPSLSINSPPFGGPAPPSPAAAAAVAAVAAQATKDRKMASAEQLVLDLCDPELRENALLDLSKKREIFQDLAPLLWNSFGTIAALLQEIVSIYPALSPPTLTPGASNRVCNALALLQVDDPEVISFLLQTEIIPLCLRTMEMGSELSKTVGTFNCVFNWHEGLTKKVATFIVQKILLDDVGLRYICATAERFFAVGTVLANMVVSLAEQPSTRLLKHIIRCYLRLSDNPRFVQGIDDPATRRWLQQLLHNVSGGGGLASALQPGGLEHILGS